jgi:type IV secretion system protein VirB10
MSASSLPPDPPSKAPQTAPQSAVFRRAERTAPRVRQPDSPWNLALGLAVAIVLGVIVFTTLSAGRQARAQNPPVASAAPPPPVSSAPQPPPGQPAMPHVNPPVAAPAPAYAPPTADAEADQRRLRAPVMVVDLSDNAQAPSASAQAVAAPAARPLEPAKDAGGSAEERFAAQVASGGVETSHATRLSDLTRVVPQGTVIPAVLETAINSDLPGSVRAVVSRDVRGFDGAQVLIPRGSKLIGQYRNGVAYGQHRAFVIWSRILTPEGVSIDIGSPGTDPLGRGGLSGETDSHFFQRFGGSILLSVLSAGVAAASQGNASTAIVIGSPLQAQSLASAVPQKTDIPVTVKVMQGTPMQVFLTRDLDFSSVASARR